MIGVGVQCGKSAAIYACAMEHSFTVIEVRTQSQFWCQLNALPLVLDSCIYMPNSVVIMVCWRHGSGGFYRQRRCRSRYRSFFEFALVALVIKYVAIL